MVGGGNVICHWLPAICGAGEETVTQFPDARSVHDCSAKPADATGHDMVRFAPDLERTTMGLFVLNN